ncbi:hypothetical protein RB595_002774 [Gaeumannomyces hyphopodioides]
MLSIHPQDIPHHYSHSRSLRTLSYPPSDQMPYLTHFSTAAGATAQDKQQTQQHRRQEPQDTVVSQALEVARESPDGARDPTVAGILETALAQLWSKVESQPDSYVLTRDEFAVFNYFQHRFRENKLATAARRRYWDNLSA